MQYLINQAVAAAESAYAPYSNFKVGVAVEIDNHLVYTASNQECAALGSTICAERAALSYVMAKHPFAKVLRMAIYSPQSPDGVSPCGECRQFIAEVARRSKVDIEIYGLKGGEMKRISELLPYSFNM